MLKEPPSSWQTPPLSFRPACCHAKATLHLHFLPLHRNVGTWRPVGKPMDGKIRSKWLSFRANHFHAHFVRRGAAIARKLSHEVASVSVDSTALVHMVGSGCWYTAASSWRFYPFFPTLIASPKARAPEGRKMINNQISSNWRSPPKGPMGRTSLLSMHASGILLDGGKEK